MFTTRSIQCRRDIFHIIQAFTNFYSHFFHSRFFFVRHFGMDEFPYEVVLFGMGNLYEIQKR